MTLFELVTIQPIAASMPEALRSEDGCTDLPRQVRRRSSLRTPRCAEFSVHRSRATPVRLVGVFAVLYNLRWLNQSTLSNVAISTCSTVRHGPCGLISSVLYSQFIVSPRGVAPRSRRNGTVTIWRCPRSWRTRRLSQPRSMKRTPATVRPDVPHTDVPLPSARRTSRRPARASATHRGRSYEDSNRRGPFPSNPANKSTYYNGLTQWSQLDRVQALPRDCS